MKVEDSRLMAGTTLISSVPEPVANPDSKTMSAAQNDIASAAQTDLWIFRDGGMQTSGPEMVRDLARRISRGQNNAESLLDALIQAGELESALADAASPCAQLAAALTDELTWVVCSGTADVRRAMQIVETIHAPDRMSISPPEGFTYYALHPLDFAKVTSGIAGEPVACALIGIRSIGTTLSAMCGAGLKEAGRAVSRITVRPTGHPYARQTEFTAPEKNWLREQLARCAQFLVVDEGPGRSGSTFLSVAEALAHEGIPQELITIVGSRQPDPHELCAKDAAARWQAFRFVSTSPSVNSRFERCTYAGGGEWRKFAFKTADEWPEAWPQMERLKFISPDRKSLFKFEGMGPLGAEVRARALMLAEWGLSPRVRDAGDGFLEYEFLTGTPLRSDDFSASLLEQMARYCAFRFSNFPAPQSAPSELRHMLEHNVQQEFGLELHLPNEALLTAAPILTDGRMQPYEWIAGDDRKFIKTDAISHGDDHFFPGPCDVTWDLAGIAVEWQLDRDARDRLLVGFKGVTGRDVHREFPLYMLAYSVFRLGFCKMGISTAIGSSDEQRLRSAYARYRTYARRLLETQIGQRLPAAAGT
jgi:hypothetical protein